MRIAVSSEGKGLESQVSKVFARSPYFLIAEAKDQKIGKTEVVENKGLDQMRGAGITVAKLMAEKDVEVVVTGNVGPRALEILRQFGIEVYLGEGKIEGVLQKFLAGKLQKI